MGFFEYAPEPIPRARRHRFHPAWMRPELALPVAVPITLVLAGTDDLAVGIHSVNAYPAGFEFTMSLISLVERRHLHATGSLEHMVRGGELRELPGEFLRLGVVFADGRTATNLGSSGPPSPGSSNPMLQGGGGGGGMRRHDAAYYVWPLPPEGPLQFICEWPAYGIPESTVSVEATPILQAATQAIVLWPEGDGEELSSEGGEAPPPIATARRPDLGD
jgi:hypothetical protein